MLEKIQVSATSQIHDLCLLQSLFFMSCMHIYAHLDIYIQMVIRMSYDIKIFICVILGCSHYSQEEKPRTSYEDNF